MTKTPKAAAKPNVVAEPAAKPVVHKVADVVAEVVAEIAGHAEPVAEPLIPAHLRADQGEDIATSDFVVVARVPKTDPDGNVVQMKFYNAAGQRVVTH